MTGTHLDLMHLSETSLSVHSNWRSVRASERTGREVGKQEGGGRRVASTSPVGCKEDDKGKWFSGTQLNTVFSCVPLSTPLLKIRARKFVRARERERERKREKEGGREGGRQRERPECVCERERMRETDRARERERERERDLNRRT